MAKELKSETVAFRTTDKIASYINAEAERRDRPVSYIINEVLTAYVNEKKAAKNGK